jgi:hypothetical protein
VLLLLLIRLLLLLLLINAISLCRANGLSDLLVVR